MKEMDLLGFLVIKLIVYYCWIVGCLIKFVIGLEKSEFIHIISYLWKTFLAFHNVIIHIKSIANKNKNEYYCNIFLVKGSYKYKSNTRHF